MVTVTVGLPVYNAAPYLAEAIQSVINQSFTDWELVVVDDGSTDESLAIARSFTDPRIKLIADGKNTGQSVRLNQISRMATGKYIARMDADDVMTVDRLQTQVHFMNEHSEVDLVSSYVYSIGTDNKVYGMRGTTHLPQTLGEAVSGFPIVHPAVLTRRSWSVANPYNEQIPRVQDYELWLRTWHTSRFFIINRPLLFYREIGIPYKNKYLRSSAQIRHILETQYRTELGWRKTYQIKTKTVLKGALYVLFNLLNREDWLLKRRNRPLSSEDQSVAEKLLAKATNRPKIASFSPL
ncbi:glycosyltransferase family 2 protein [Larkinella terrae]|uniref:Glycosyltransferase n=1 Tax=Larkinella terrae TaxID=2025311 RepID=A0A7K0EH82_9BACT|nr:glycosyltransferase [Larkinella terrae]MRS60941.1 glycosyltransferase [Larkinella terrae]